jgi:hypothetical protein
MDLQKTNRGFALGEFADRNGQSCSLQKSSVATEDCIWLGLNDADPKIMCSDARALGIQPESDAGWMPYPIPEAVSLHTRMHLSRDQVRDLLPALQHFVDTGELPTQ